jgi:nucleoside-diphosphate-sugar epimerase
VPTTEALPRRPLEAYGIEKAAIEALLLDEGRAGRLRATVLHPGHIVGPGWLPVNPAGHLDTSVFADLANGAVVTLPNLGLETLHHVHADDVAQAFELALSAPTAAGESFHVVSERALTLRGYAEAVASWFGKPANLRYLPWEAWRAAATEPQAVDTFSHISHSPCMSIDKARDLLGYAPRYSSLQAVHEAVAWLIAEGAIDVGGQELRSLST